MEGWKQKAQRNELSVMMWHRKTKSYAHKKMIPELCKQLTTIGQLRSVRFAVVLSSTVQNLRMQQLNVGTQSSPTFWLSVKAPKYPLHFNWLSCGAVTKNWLQDYRDAHAHLLEFADQFQAKRHLQTRLTLCWKEKVHTENLYLEYSNYFGCLHSYSQYKCNVTWCDWSKIVVKYHR